YALLLGQPLTDVLQPRQEGHFLYLTGVEEPDASLLLAGAKAAPLRIAAAPREAVFLRDSHPRFARFYGLRLRPGAGSAAELGVETTRAAPSGGDGLGRALAAALPEAAVLHLPAYAGPDHAPVREIRRAVADALARDRPDVRVVDLHPEMTRMRAVKDALEVASLRRAIAFTEQAFREGLPEIHAGGSEAALDGALIRAVRRLGARPAYAFVVGAGPNGAVPHHFRNDGPLREGDLVVIDAGAEADRYAADVTRTFPISGRFSKRQREVYGVVLEAQRAAIAAVRPGADLGDVDRAARSVIARAGLAERFLHATSHHVGLDVHDPGPARIEVGMTFTVEPGVYLPEEGFGVRIEDVVLVTESGAEVLSAGLPKEPDEVEALLAKR
ncbi:MAG: M24 family metallopeptidase, partial [Planctomycetota bacterium]